MGGLIKKNVVHELRREGSCSFHESSVLFCPFNLCRNCRGVRVVRRLQKKGRDYLTRIGQRLCYFIITSQGGHLIPMLGTLKRLIVGGRRNPGSEVIIRQPLTSLQACLHANSTHLQENIHRKYQIVS